MTVICDSQGKRIRLDRKVGSGGEAIIYEVVGQSDRVAKIYEPSPRLGYEQKLTWMRDHPPDDPTRAQGHASIAWPMNLLYDNQMRFKGYLMPYIQNAASFLEVFNPRLRAHTLPQFNWQYLHRTARNLAAALGALHARGYVVGDLNESNVMVTPSALVTLIDTDSFQVLEQGGARLLIYFCPVGKPEYTPPELQGKSLSKTQRDPESDCFGLGVLIFQLLMDGNHPFRARWKGRGDPPPLEEKIRKGWFPHAKSLSGPIAPPPNTSSLNTLHPQVAHLMQCCFVDGHQDPRQRPSPEEWERTIAEAEKSLVECRSGHYYSGHLGTCPRCSARRKGAQTPLQSLRSIVPRPRPQPVAPSPATVLCPDCGKVNDANEIYCQRCAHPLHGNRRCSHCNHSIPSNARYCVNCGRRV